MIYTPKIQRAIRFAIRVHEQYQKQKRKGKDVPYVVHPLIAGMILSRIGASEELVIAGILHDAIEDTVKDKRKTRDLIIEKFGCQVVDLVDSVTEPVKDLPWDERKAEALEHIKTFSHDSLLLKSADVISNQSDTLSDYEKEGEVVFSKFNAPKEKVIKHGIDVISTILDLWDGNPLKEDLLAIKKGLEEIE